MPFERKRRAHGNHPHPPPKKKSDEAFVADAIQRVVLGEERDRDREPAAAALAGEAPQEDFLLLLFICRIMSWGDWAKLRLSLPCESPSHSQLYRRNGSGKSYIPMRLRLIDRCRKYGSSSASQKQSELM